MWLERNIRQVSMYGQVFIVEAPDEYGFSHVVAEMRSRGPHVLWIALQPEDAGDKIRQGNKLAEAATRAFSSPLFGNGLPYPYGLSVIQRNLELLAPLTFVLSNAEFGPHLASAFLAFSRAQSRVILQFGNIPSFFEYPSKSRLLSKSELRLTRPEADMIVRNRLSADQTAALLRRSSGAYESFFTALNNQLGVPQIARPTPTGEIRISDAPTVDIKGLFNALVVSESWIDAFEVAVRALPDRIYDVIDSAGEMYFSQGLFEHFWKIVKDFEPELLSNERVLYWWYAAAVATNNHRSLEAQVRAYLKVHAAPELRALVAISMPNSSIVVEAERAFKDRDNAFTTRALGFAHAVNGDPIVGIQFLQTAHKSALEVGNRNLIVATSNELAVAYQLAGKYREAYRWATWALKQFTDLGLNEELRRLFIVSEIAYPAMLIGRSEAVASLVESVVVSDELYGIPSTEGILSTLCDYAILKENLSQALNYAELNCTHLPPGLMGFGAISMVRVLLELGRFEEAIEHADATYCNASNYGEVEELRGCLALGTALAPTDPIQAKPYLERAQTGFQKLLSAPYLAQASIVLAGIYLRLGQEEDARKTLGIGEVSLHELAKPGWLLLGGSGRTTHEVWNLWTEDTTPLELRFLGSRRIRLRHRTIDYPLRWCEILVVLAFHPDGLKGERLSTLLYGDSGNFGTLKSNLSRMRKDVPVSSRPYRIELQYTADFVELDRALREGRVREALELYHGPLLPESEAPYIVELREYLEETLRQAALNSGDVGVLLSLARKLVDDLELWEAASQRLSKNDPLLPLAKAHVKRIQRAWGG